MDMAFEQKNWSHEGERSPGTGSHLNPDWHELCARFEAARQAREALANRPESVLAKGRGSFAAAAADGVNPVDSTNRNPDTAKIAFNAGMSSTGDRGTI